MTLYDASSEALHQRWPSKHHMNSGRWRHGCCPRYDDKSVIRVRRRTAERPARPPLISAFTVAGAGRQRNYRSSGWLDITFGPVIHGTREYTARLVEQLGWPSRHRTAAGIMHTSMRSRKWRLARRILGGTGRLLTSFCTFLWVYAGSLSRLTRPPCCGPSHGVLVLETGVFLSSSQRSSVN